MSSMPLLHCADSLLHYVYCNAEVFIHKVINNDSMTRRFSAEVTQGFRFRLRTAMITGKCTCTRSGIICISNIQCT